MDWLIVGLGNPGREYELTPHNIGFIVCDSLSGIFNFDFVLNSEIKGFLGRFLLKNNNIGVLKPLTFMNLSGVSVFLTVNFYRLSLERLIVIHDDIDLPLGKIRIKRNSSSGGHKGVESIIDILGSKDFIRIKIGVGKSENPKEYVLKRFNDNELKLVDRIVELSAKAVVDIIEKGLSYSMNKYNNIFLEV